MARKLKRYRVKTNSKFSSASLGVFDSKKEASEFKKRTAKAWKADPRLKALMKHDTLVVEPVTP